MRTLYFDSQLSSREESVPIVTENDALIQVTQAGICNTDLELARGYMGFCGVLGHEFVGIVHESSNRRLVGKRVVGEINCVCHDCTMCRAGRPHHCTKRTVLGIQGRSGAFAEFLALPNENLHVLPDSVSDDAAVFVEPLAAAFRILEQVPFYGHETAIVLGDGKLGQLVARVLKTKVTDLLCVGKHKWKLSLLEAAGLRTAPADADLPLGEADVVVEATGSASGLTRALELVRPEGVVVLKTTVAGETALDLSLPVINEIRIIGSRCGPFPPAIDALARGSVDVTPLISERYPLIDGVKAMNRASTPGVMKVLLTMQN